jgi:hypothetical protein
MLHILLKIYDTILVTVYMILNIFNKLTTFGTDFPKWKGQPLITTIIHFYDWI